LSDFFGFDCSVSQVTQSDVRRFYAHLSSLLQETSLSRYFRTYKTVFDFAVKEGFITANPFMLKVKRVDTNEERQFYISRDIAFKVLRSFRDDRGRLMFVLARFAGLRIPSELLPLRFKDFDLSNDLICISRDTKTGYREIPFFREVRDVFLRLTGKPDDFVFEGWTRRMSYSVLESALKRSGIPQWEKLFINLRSSFITDLHKMGYDEKTLDAICGNSALVRKKHYVQFERRVAYRKVLDDNERMYIDDVPVEQQGFRLILEEVQLLRKLLVQNGISLSEHGEEKKISTSSRGCVFFCINLGKLSTMFVCVLFLEGGIQSNCQDPR
jgi:integrase